MSLIQLLSVGKSLSSAKDEPSPYRMAQKFRLPNFGSRRAVEVKPRDVPGPEKPAHSRPTPVQEELSLDRVRVVRNDLHEADLELFHAASRPRSSRRAERSAGSHRMSVAGWSAIIRRLFRADKISS